jgi:hypothetical protein
MLQKASWRVPLAAVGGANARLCQAAMASARPAAARWDEKTVADVTTNVNPRRRDDGRFYG